MADFQLGDDLVVEGAVKEILQGEMQCVGAIGLGAGSQILVGDDHARVFRQIVDSAVFHRNIQPCFLYLFAQDAGTGGAGTHAGVAGDVHGFHVVKLMRIGTGGKFERLHLVARGGEFLITGGGHAAHKDAGNKERHHATGGDRTEHRGITAFGRHRQYGENRARRGGRNQTAVHKDEGEDAGHAARNHRQQQTRIHQHIGEINFVNAAEEMDDGSAASGLLGGTLAEQHIREQYAEAGAGVRFNQEENGAANFLRLRNAERRENTVVDGIVQEENLRRFDENRSQRQQIVFDEKIHTGRERTGKPFHRRPDDDKRQQRQQHTNNAGGKIVHQHLETALDLALNGLVKLLDCPTAERADNHRAQEHRNISTNDDAHRGNRTDHRATIPASELAAGITDEQRQQIRNHRAD